MRALRFFLILCVAALGLFSAASSQAAVIAVFGDNATDDLLSSLGHTVSLVTDADLATAGFLDAFDALFVTRDGFSFGSGLSAGAAANVIAYVGATGNVVLLNADFADDIGDPNTDLIYANAATFAAASGHGYVGEFNGAVMALASNSDGFLPLGLIPGAAGPLGFDNGGSGGSVSIAPAGVGHPVLSGVTLPYDPAGVEFGADAVGVPAGLVLATFDGGNPAIIALAGTDVAAVPEPSSMVVFALGSMGVFGAWRRRRMKKAA
jgi:hypothetical protein